MSHTCPNQHASDTADFCSVCGAEIAATAPPAVAGQPCPACGTPRERAAQAFCEACGHDLRQAAAPDVDLDLVSSSESPAHPPVQVRWDVVVRVDANLYG